MIKRAMVQVLAAAVLSAAPSCTRLQQPTAEDDISYTAEPPPNHWQSAVAFYFDDSSSVRVEFFDGERTRLVSSRDALSGAFGRTPWYRVHPRGALTTTLRVSAGVRDNEVTLLAEHPIEMERNLFYEDAPGLAVRRKRSPPTYSPEPAAARPRPR